MKLTGTILLPMAMAFAPAAMGQDVAVKTNLADDAILDVNIGAEVGLADKWTLDIPVSFNNWTLSHGRRWKHLTIQPGARYWLCQSFGGHFFGAYLHGGLYNIGGFNGRLNMLGTDMRKLENSRYEGWFAGGGVSYGYAWMVGTHWNLEAEIGIGYSYTRYDQYRCAGCGKKIKSDRSHNYAGLTKAALNVVYLF